MVPHSEIFRPDLKRKGALPTFNSCAIESQLHRIPGLAECYLYLNDDFFLLRPLQASSASEALELSSQARECLLALRADPPT